MPNKKAEYQPGTDLVVVRDRERSAERIARQKVFLEAYEKFGNLKRVERETGISKRTHCHWIHRDPAYVAAYEKAREAAIENMEAEAWRRGVEGYLQPVFQHGRKVGEMRVYSDNLLMFLLKGARPEQYRDNWKAEFKVQERADPDLSKLTREELETLLAIATQVRLRSLPEAGVVEAGPVEDSDVFQ